VSKTIAYRSGLANQIAKGVKILKRAGDQYDPLGLSN
jgi:hypothetical protein